MHIGTGGSDADEPRLVRPYIGTDDPEPDPEATVVLRLATAVAAPTEAGSPDGQPPTDGASPTDAPGRRGSGRLAVAAGIVLAAAVLPTAFALVRQSDRAESAGSRSPTWAGGASPAATALRGQVGEQGADNAGRAGSPRVSRPAVLAAPGPGNATALAAPPVATPTTPSDESRPDQAPPPAPAAPSVITPTYTSALPPLNLALLRPVLASSVQSAQFDARFAVDGDPATRWSSAGQDKQWIQVDLGLVMKVSEVHIAWHTNSHASRYEVRVSIDGERWHTRAKESDGDGRVDDVSFKPTRARYVMLYCTKRGTSQGSSMSEFEVR